MGPQSLIHPRLIHRLAIKEKMPGMNGIQFRSVTAGDECQVKAVPTRVWRCVETSGAVARAILPVKGALPTGRIARATFRAGKREKDAGHYVEQACRSIDL